MASSNSKLSTKELASIVTHGADKIFASEKGTYTVMMITRFKIG